MSKPKKEKVTSKGLLYPRASSGKFEITRHLPRQELGLFVQHYWIARWDLRGKDPYVTSTLPYPGINLVFENDGARIWGVFTSKSDKVLEGEGRGVSVLFRPGGFYPFYDNPISDLTDNHRLVGEVYGQDGNVLEAKLLSSDDDLSLVALIEDFLLSREPKPDNHIKLINEIIDTIVDDRGITKVRQVCELFGLSERTLQDLFATYVGVGLKWVIMRYRMQDAANRISEGVAMDWAALALDLGYSDQPHFIHDFQRVIGRSPGDYARIETETKKPD